MFNSVLNFVTQLSMVYLLTALFVILDLLLLTKRAQRLRQEKAERDEKHMRRIDESERERKAYEQKQELLRAAT